MKTHLLILIALFTCSISKCQTIVDSKDSALFNVFLKYKSLSGVSNPLDTMLFIERLHGLETAIRNSSHIIEGVHISSDYYYIPEEDQTYYRKHVLVHKTLRGKNVAESDTVIIIIKQPYPGKGPPLIEPSHSNYPILWIDNKISCLFLTENIYPEEKEQDQWSHFKKLNVWSDYKTPGYAARYDAIAIVGKLINARGILFEKRSDWYNYLKQYPDIKIPEGQ